MHPIIIIGGGPVGLSAAVCLATQGICSIIIEKHPATTTHPKARGVNGRSMELFRAWGIEEPLKRYELPKEAYRFTWIEDFQGNEITRVQATQDYSPYSPTGCAVISQDNVEEELFKKAQSTPLIDLRFNTEMTHMFQDEKHVTVEVLDKHTGQREVLTAEYVIAADGANSTVRKILNIEMDGMDSLGEFCNIYCEMDVSKYVAHRPSVGFVFTKPGKRGLFLLSKDGYKKWLMGVRLDGKPKEAFNDDAYCVEFIKSVIEDPAIEVKLINKAFWTMAALIAKQYRYGRVFLAGDAAHRLPPTGGYGMNTGIQDVHNLAWKLAWVLQGKADPTLLDTYFTERLQIAKTNMLWSMTNARRFETIFKALDQKDTPTFEAALKDQSNHVNNILLDLGFIYGSDYQTQKEYIPSAVVGARAPHCWLEQDGKQISTLDLYKDSFVLVCAPDAHHWQDSYKDFSCTIMTIGPNGTYTNPAGDFLEKYGITNTGAVLVRPDGHVAWAAQDAQGDVAHLSWLR